MKTISTTEERIWAVISHLSALALGIGILLPIVGWADQRRKSNYSSFQCLQALGYQSLGYTVWALFSAVIGIIHLVIVLRRSDVSTMPLDATVGEFVKSLGILTSILVGLYFLPAIVAAIVCATGREYRYPLFGDRLARYLGYAPSQTPSDSSWLQEEHEIRWVAAMGHFSILIVLWGMLAPLTAWIVFGRHSPFLRFQSIQSLVFQALTTLLYVVGLSLYFVGFLLFLALAGPDLSAFGLESLLLFGAFLLISLLLLLLVPLLHILGQWAGYRVLKGDPYSYPLVGRLVSRWTSRPLEQKEKPG